MKKRKIIISTLVGFALFILAVIGGLATWSFGLFAEQAKEAIQNNSVVQEHIGEVDQIKWKLIATGMADGADEFVFRVEGSKADGVISAEFISVDENTEEIGSGTLQLSSGEIYDLLN